MKLGKILLFAEATKCPELFKFYRDLGFPVITQTPNCGWCEFDTGTTHLCIHSEINPDQQYQNRTGTHFSIQLSDRKELDITYEMLKEKCELHSALDVLSRGQITEICSAATMNFDYFNVGDPVGNIVQFEANRGE